MGGNCSTEGLLDALMPPVGGLLAVGVVGYVYPFEGLSRAIAVGGAGIGTYYTFKGIWSGNQQGDTEFAAQVFGVSIGATGAALLEMAFNFTGLREEVLLVGGGAIGLVVLTPAIQPFLVLQKDILGPLASLINSFTGLFGWLLCEATSPFQGPTPPPYKQPPLPGQCSGYKQSYWLRGSRVSDKGYSYLHVEYTPGQSFRPATCDVYEYNTQTKQNTWAGPVPLLDQHDVNYQNTASDLGNPGPWDNALSHRLFETMVDPSKVNTDNFGGYGYETNLQPYSYMGPPQVNINTGESEIDWTLKPSGPCLSYQPTPGLAVIDSPPWGDKPMETCDVYNVVTGQPEYMVSLPANKSPGNIIADLMENNGPFSTTPAVFFARQLLPPQYFEVPGVNQRLAQVQSMWGQWPEGYQGTDVALPPRCTGYLDPEDGFWSHREATGEQPETCDLYQGGQGLGGGDGNTGYQGSVPALQAGGSKALFISDMVSNFFNSQSGAISGLYMDKAAVGWTDTDQQLLSTAWRTKEQTSGPPANEFPFPPGGGHGSTPPPPPPPTPHCSIYNPLPGDKLIYNPGGHPDPHQPASCDLFTATNHWVGSLPPDQTTTGGVLNAVTDPTGPWRNQETLWLAGQTTKGWDSYDNSIVSSIINGDSPIRDQYPWAPPQSE